MKRGEMPMRQDKKYAKEVEEIVDNMCLMDDDLMSRVFDENIPATQVLIQTIIGRGVTVVEAKGQWDIKNSLTEGRGIRLDVFARDSDGEYFDCEVQRRDEGADPRRARFNSSMLDTRMLNKSQSFTKLRDSYVIFITENDFFQENEPIYNVKRKLPSGAEFIDGSHIIYVNGQYDGDDELGHLLSDMKNRTADGFYYKELEDGVRHFKMEEERRKSMSEAVERYADKRVEEDREELILKNLIKGKSPEEIADFFDMSVDEVRKIEQKMLIEA
ncbi:MAG TPA: hypothetical protein DCR12_00365 [Lachnospiraceae bacterium]|nr:hypothetical protein [Lachnospiraceae bacterium]